MEARLKPFGVLFARSLNDLIVGIRRRQEPEDLADYLKKVVTECREEAREADLDTKALAILKLAYLEMYGQSMGWAQFPVIEVMSSSKFQQKRIGYLAAAQCLHGNDELLMLATNLVKSDLASSDQSKVGVALSGASSFVTPHLASDISEDVLKMLNHSQPYIRKKAVVAAYRVVLQFPEALPQFLERLKSKLSDEDGSVVAASVNVLCELSTQSRDKSAYIEFAPILYNIMTSTTNNWCLVKLLKLFAVFTIAEPRLISKIRPQVVRLLNDTEALSLVVEAANCLLHGDMLENDDWTLADTLVRKLEKTLEYHDANLTFVVLEAFVKIAKINPGFLSDQYTSVFALVDDQDLAVRRKVLSLLPFILDEDTIAETIERLLEQVLHPPESINPKLTPWTSYVERLIEVSLELCAQNNYELVPNFEWYIDQLSLVISTLEKLDLAKNSEILYLVGSQLIDIALRVSSARTKVVLACTNLGASIREQQLLSRASFVIGEYSETAAVSGQVNCEQMLSALIRFSSVADAMNSQAIAKVLATWSRCIPSWDARHKQLLLTGFKDSINALEKTGSGITSTNIEIKERALQVIELMRLGCEAIEKSELGDRPPALLSVGFSSLFNGWDMVPVAATALQRVEKPLGLDLEAEVKLPEPPVFQDIESEDESEPESVQKSESASNAIVAENVDPFYIGADPKRAAKPEIEPPIVVNQPEVREFKPKKVARVKVQIAADETLGAEDGSTVLPVPRQKRNSSILQVSSRLNDLQVSNTMDSQDVPIKVKHKNVKKKKKPKPE